MAFPCISANSAYLTWCPMQLIPLRLSGGAKRLTSSLVHRWPIVFFFLRSMIITSHSPMDRPPRLHLNHRIYILLLWQHCILTTSLPGLNFFLDLLSLLVIIWLCFSACHLLFIFCSKFVLYVSTKLLKNDMFY